MFRFKKKKKANELQIIKKTRYHAIRSAIESAVYLFLNDKSKYFIKCKISYRLDPMLSKLRSEKLVIRREVISHFLKIEVTALPLEVVLDKMLGDREAFVKLWETLRANDLSKIVKNL